MNNKTALYMRTIATYGKEHQLKMAMEESAELIQSINKVMREEHEQDKYTDKVLAMLSEMADVEIMIEQIKLIFKVDKEIFDLIKENKLYRLQSKLNEI